MRKPTIDDVISTVKQIAIEIPDYLYTGFCEYAPNTDNPHGCIFGYALQRLGISPEKLDRELIERTLITLSHDCYLEVLSPWDANKIAWCGVVQACQDGRFGEIPGLSHQRFTWGNAVKKANQLFGSRVDIKG